MSRPTMTGTHQETSANEGCTNKEDGDTRDKGWKDSLDHPFGHEGDEHHKPGGDQQHANEAAVCNVKGVACFLQRCQMGWPRQVTVP